MILHIFLPLCHASFSSHVKNLSIVHLHGLSWLKINYKGKKFSADSLRVFPGPYWWLPKSFVCPLLPVKSSWEYFLYLFHQILLTALLERVWSPFILLGWCIKKQHRSSPFHVDVPQNYVFTLIWKHLLCSSLHLQVLFLCISETENCLGKEEDRKKRGLQHLLGEAGNRVRLTTPIAWEHCYPKTPPRISSSRCASLLFSCLTPFLWLVGFRFVFCFAFFSPVLFQALEFSVEYQLLEYDTFLWCL